MAMEGCPELLGVKDRLRDIYKELQGARRSPD